MKTLRLRIHGMHHEACAISITMWLKRDPGVQRTYIDWQAGTGEVDYDPERTTDEAILNSRMFARHYPAERLP